MADQQIPAEVLDRLIGSSAVGEAAQTLRGGITVGDPIHPGDTFGAVVAWLWTTEQLDRLSEYVADYIGELRRRPEHAERLPQFEDFLTGLGFALPFDIQGDNGKVEELRDHLRETIPPQFADHLAN